MISSFMAWNCSSRSVLLACSCWGAAILLLHLHSARCAMLCWLLSMLDHSRCCGWFVCALGWPPCTIHFDVVDGDIAPICGYLSMGDGAGGLSAPRGR